MSEAHTSYRCRSNLPRLRIRARGWVKQPRAASVQVSCRRWQQDRVWLERLVADRRHPSRLQARPLAWALVLDRAWVWVLAPLAVPRLRSQDFLVLLDSPAEAALLPLASPAVSLLLVSQVVFRDSLALLVSLLVAHPRLDSTLPLGVKGCGKVWYT